MTAGAAAAGYQQHGGGLLLPWSGGLWPEAPAGVMILDVKLGSGRSQLERLSAVWVVECWVGGVCHMLCHTLVLSGHSPSVGRGGCVVHA